MTPAPTPVLELRNVSKQFGGTRALDSVDLTLHEGEIVGLLGQNGSGKSTLVKVLAGAHAPEPGATVRLRGAEKTFPLRREEMRLGVVAQDLGLVERISVIENLNIGRRIAPSGRGRMGINWRAERRLADAVLASYGIRLPLNARVGDLPLLQRAMLAIARCAQDIAGEDETGAGAWQGGVMILDEPTVFLPEQETAFLLDLVRRSARNGTSVVIVSHDLAVIREIAQRAVVLRNGKLVADMPMAEVTDRELVDLIIGYAPEHGTEAGTGGAQL
jgi:ribose transport system ATP-binding protein